MTQPIAIVGMACRYPDAASVGELWENALARRQAFRRIPEERLRLADYVSGDPAAVDSIVTTEAAVIEGFELDRVRFRIAGSTYRATDLTHWLALDVAAQALEDAGFPEAQGLPTETTGVVLGNTLTGEFSRAEVLRLRWPYVRRVAAAALQREGWSAERRRVFLTRLETDYKSSFNPVGEDTLAGGLANTIAGRICNYFDLKGGGYTVDGACASSLLAVTHGCSLLTLGDLEVVVAGGVDLSLDPFELVGFARTGALALDTMRIYDQRPTGFLPGEGCGLVVLMRRDDAERRGLRVYATIRGWGVSSDGSGGITRPEAEGQALAVRRAYARAGLGIDTVPLIEGHGTGTAVGDAAELAALAAEIRRGREAAGIQPLMTGSSDGLGAVAIGSIKANIGHTKAAAGAAGLIKATMAVSRGIIPPTTGTDRPHAELEGPDAVLTVCRTGGPWPASAQRRAGVSAMGFGGINTHLVLEAPEPGCGSGPDEHEQQLLHSGRDAALLLLEGSDAADLDQQVRRLCDLVPRLARSQLQDLAAELARRGGGGSLRAAVVATRPGVAKDQLERLRSWLGEWPGADAGVRCHVEPRAAVMLGSVGDPPRIGLLLPGQGAPPDADGGAWRVIRSVETLLATSGRAAAGSPCCMPGLSPDDQISTEHAQPAIALASLAALAVLESLGIRGGLAVGHSLGELVALAWAGALDRSELPGLAAARGRAMAEACAGTESGPGAMANLATGVAEVAALIEKIEQAGHGRAGSLVIACHNGPLRTVVSGPEPAVLELVRGARREKIAAARLPVSHAFHSPLMAPAADALARAVAAAVPGLPRRPVISTVTGRELEPDTDLVGLLVDQLTSPVLFAEAVAAARDRVDLWLEVGPGSMLSGLLADQPAAPAFATDACGGSFVGLCTAVAAAWVHGVQIDRAALPGTVIDPFTRALDLDRRLRFFANPCERAPIVDEPEAAALDDAGGGEATGDSPSVVAAPAGPAAGGPSGAEPSGAEPSGAVGDPVAMVRGVVARRTEMPLEAVEAGHRLLSDLHLSSISVGQVVVEACLALGLDPPAAPTRYADATVRDLAEALDELRRSGARAALDGRPPAGVDSWVRPFTVALVETPPVIGEEGQSAGSASQAGPFAWRIVAPAGHPIAARFPEAASDTAGDTARDTAGDTARDTASDTARDTASDTAGDTARDTARDTASDTASDTARDTALDVLLCLEPGARETSIPDLLRATRLAVRARRLVVVQHGGGAAGIARTFFLETEVPTLVVDLPPEHPRAVELILAEAQRCPGFVEAHYDLAGTRRVPRLRPAVVRAEPADSHPVLSAADVLLVTGGGKGIVAECALELARRTGAQLAVLGRSRPEADAVLAANLERLGVHGVEARYRSVDVCDRRAVAEAVAALEAELGPVTAVLHGAGRNRPRALAELDEASFRRTVAPKLTGLRNLLEAVPLERLGLLICFGSVIARSGMAGEADYAAANEWLRLEVEQLAARGTGCRCVVLEWSVWSGVGMGERLGRIAALEHQGISAISPEDGVRALVDLVAGPGAGAPVPPVSLVVSSRLGSQPTLELEQADLPFLRFLETPRVHYPGIELVIDAEISAQDDPYLAEHALDGQPLLPAVLGLEAMAQLTRALVGQDAGPPVLEQVRFDRPVAPAGGSTTLRLAGLRRADGSVRAAVRCAETGLEADHFQAVLRPGAGAPALSGLPEDLMLRVDDGEPDLPPSGVAELYDLLLFHQGRFRRVGGYPRLSATSCVVDIEPGSDEAGLQGWFGRYLPQELLLGDPGARDAALHAIQACIPHARVLPQAVQRVTLGRLDSTARHRVVARERRREGEVLVWDLAIYALVEPGQPRLVEVWEGLSLKIIEPLAPPGPWPISFIGPVLERRMQELAPLCALEVALASMPEIDRSQRGERLLRRLLSDGTVLVRRPDGRPEAGGGSEPPCSRPVSLAHDGDLVLGVAGMSPVGCDLEQVVAREPAIWQGLLGGAGRRLVDAITAGRNEPFDAAATRVWAARECLVKVGADPGAPLAVDEINGDGWVMLRSGRRVIGTILAPVGRAGHLVAVAVLASEPDA